MVFAMLNGPPMDANEEKVPEILFTSISRDGNLKEMFCDL